MCRPYSRQAKPDPEVFEQVPEVFEQVIDLLDYDPSDVLFMDDHRLHMEASDREKRSESDR